MSSNPEIPFFVSVPHSGEQVPKEVTWLKGLSEVTLMRDVDRFVDQLYKPVIELQKIPAIMTQWHRYVVDLNRMEGDYDAAAVEGAEKPRGSEPKGLHWSVTTHNEILIPEPMSMELHKQLVENYYQPFHRDVKKLRSQLKSQFDQVFHLDLHSMPSVGTTLHADPGEERAEIVISDYHGTTSGPFFKDLVMESYQKSGFQVAYNHPYVGGGITRMYGDPENNIHNIQVELKRSLYMDEKNKQLSQALLGGIRQKLQKAISSIIHGIKDLNHG